MANQNTPKSPIEKDRTQLRVELKDELDDWIRRRFWGMSLIVGGVVIVGAYLLVKAAVGDLVKDQIADYKEYLREARQEINLVVKEAVRSTANAEFLSEAAAAVVKKAEAAAANARTETEAAIEQTKQTIDEAVANAKLAVNRAIEEATQAAELARQAAEDAKEASETADAVKERVADLEAQLPDIELTTDDKKAIYVLQTRRATTSKVPDNSDNTYTDLTFSVRVDETRTQLTRMQILAYIDKVNYVFAERWFNPSVRSGGAASDGFPYTVKVWGRTRVKVEIHLKSPPEMLIREGQMNLEKETKFEVGPS